MENEKIYLRNGVLTVETLELVYFAPIALSSTGPHVATSRCVQPTSWLTRSLQDHVIQQTYPVDTIYENDGCSRNAGETRNLSQLHIQVFVVEP